MSVSLDTINQTSLVPQTLLGISGANQSININSTDGIVFNDATLNLTASLSWNGIITDKPTGFDILSPLNMNSNNIDNVNSLNSTAGGYDLTIGSSNQVIVNSTDNIALNSGVNIFETAQIVRLRDGINDEEIVLDMGTNTDQIPRIVINHRNQISQIYNDDNLNIESDQQFFTTIGEAITIESLNDSIHLVVPNGKIFGERTFGDSNGEFVANTFTGSLNGNASTADYASNAGTAQTIVVSNENTDALYYPTFVSNNSGNFALKVDKTATPLTYNPSNSTLYATTFSGSATLLATTGVTNNATYYLPFVSSSATSSGQTLYTDQNGHITFNPSTNQLSTNGTITNNGLTMNGSASQFLINNASASVPAISAPNAQLISFPSANVTATTFTGALSGNATTATTATNATNAVIGTDNVSTLVYPTFVKTSGAGNKGLFIDDTITTLTYNPSTSTLSSSHITNTSGYYYGLSKDAYPALNPSSSGVKATSTWTTRISAADYSWQSVCWSAELGLFVAVANGNMSSSGYRVMTSPNGITWTIRTSAADNTWQSVCWSAQLRLFVAVSYGATGNGVMTSPDGTNWTIKTTAAAVQWSSVCWSAELGLFVAVASSGSYRAMTSPDGTNWTTRNITDFNVWNSVCWSAELGLFVAVASNGGNRAMTSPDGITWTGRITPSGDNYWQSVCWSAQLGLFVAVASIGTNKAMTSPDGITWTARNPAADYLWKSVCWSAELGLFVAVSYSGTGNRVMTSPDGINWTIRTSAADNTWMSVCWSAELGLFVAVGSTGTGNRVMTSSLLGRPPTSYNVFNSDFNRIDETGNWIFNSVNIGTTSPNSSAKLQVDSTTQGFLPPRMTGTQANAIATPAEGLMVYITSIYLPTFSVKGWWGYNGTTWTQIG